MMMMGCQFRVISAAVMCMAIPSSWHAVSAFSTPIFPSTTTRAGWTTRTRARTTSYTAPSTRLNMATWSDSRAVLEYQEFLASGLQEIYKEKDGPCVIVQPFDGPNYMTDAIKQMGMGDDVVISPTEELPNGLGNKESYPIYVTVPPGQLKNFLDNLPASYYDRQADFVFLAGGPVYGNIECILKPKGYLRDTMTQFLVTGFVAKPFAIDDISIKIGMASNGEEKWAGECASCGKWQGAVEERLEKNAIRCKTGFYREWKRDMWERTMYDACLHITGAVRDEPTTLSEVALYYYKEVEDMAWQISGSLRGSRAITLTYGFEDRMFQLAEAIGTETQCEINEDMYQFSLEYFIDCNKVNEYANYAKDVKGLYPNTLVKKKSQEVMDKPPIMRQGNLRADGVI